MFTQFRSYCASGNLSENVDHKRENIKTERLQNICSRIRQRNTVKRRINLKNKDSKKEERNEYESA
jgi:hypothetical protein